jgi:hypothetical protein
MNSLGLARYGILQRLALASIAAAISVGGCTSRPIPASTENVGRSEVEFYDNRTPLDGPGEFIISFNDGSGERTLRQSDLRPRTWAFPSSPVFTTRSTGNLHIQVTFARNGEQASGILDLPLKTDWRYGISLHVTSRNPLEGCFGCMGVKSVPLKSGAVGEQLHMVWSGNSISQPAIY